MKKILSIISGWFESEESKIEAKIKDAVKKREIEIINKVVSIAHEAGTDSKIEVASLINELKQFLITEVNKI
jgi:hypothetical protein